MLCWPSEAYWPPKYQCHDTSCLQPSWDLREDAVGQVGEDRHAGADPSGMPLLYSPVRAIPSRHAHDRPAVASRR